MSYSFGKYKYLDRLVRINSRFLRDLKPGDNIRYDNPHELKHLDNILRGFYRNFFNADNLEDRLVYLLNVTGILLHFQLFYDANSRTLKVFMMNMLESIEIKVEIPVDKNHSKTHVIPFFYEPIEKCSRNNVLILEQFIQKNDQKF